MWEGGGEWKGFGLWEMMALSCEDMEVGSYSESSWERGGGGVGGAMDIVAQIE